MKTMPNRNLYIWLILIGIAICGGSLVLQNTTSVFNIVTGLGSGCVASALVAFLIDRFSWKNKEQKKLQNRDTLLSDFYEAFDAGCSGFKWMCHSERIHENIFAKKTWLEWCQTAYDSINDRSHFGVFYTKACGLFFQAITTKVNELRTQSSSLLERGIIEDDDAKALSRIYNLCSELANEANTSIEVESEIDRWSLSALYNKCEQLFHILEEAPILRAVNTKKTGKMIFDERVEPIVIISHIAKLGSLLESKSKKESQPADRDGQPNVIDNEEEPSIHLEDYDLSTFQELFDTYDCLPEQEKEATHDYAEHIVYDMDIAVVSKLGAHSIDWFSDIPHIVSDDLQSYEDCIAQIEIIRSEINDLNDQISHRRSFFPIGFLNSQRKENLRQLTDKKVELESAVDTMNSVKTNLQKRDEVLIQIERELNLYLVSGALALKKNRCLI